MKKIFLVLLVSLFLAGCVTTTPTPPVAKIDCPRPIKLKAVELNDKKDLCSPENVNIQMQNTKDIVEYSKKQDATIDCWENSNK